MIVTINLSFLKSSDIRVRSNNSTQLNGLNGRLESIFDSPNVRTPNRYFHSYQSLLIAFFVGFILAVPITGLIFFGMGMPLGTYLIPAIIGSGIAIGFGVLNLLGWLFPNIETEYNVQRKLRAMILTALGVLIGGLLVNYLSKIFFH